MADLDKLVCGLKRSIKATVLPLCNLIAILILYDNSLNRTMNCITGLNN